MALPALNDNTWKILNSESECQTQPRVFRDQHPRATPEEEKVEGIPWVEEQAEGGRSGRGDHAQAAVQGVQGRDQQDEAQQQEEESARTSRLGGSAGRATTTA